MARINSINEKQHTGTGIMLLMLTAAAGIAAGAVFTALNGGQAPSVWLHQYLMPVSSGTPLSEAILHIFTGYILFLSAFFITGTSAIGHPVSLCLLLFRGIGAGVSVSYLYYVSGISAFPEVVFAVLPEAAAALIIAAAAARESMRSSCGLVKCMVQGDTYENGVRSFKMYCVRFMVLSVISLLTAAGCTILNYVYNAVK